MSKFEKYLEFFVQNGITLNEDQINDLRSKSHEYIEESFSDFISVLKTWKTSNQKHAKQKFYSDDLTEEEYEDLKETINILKTEEEYSKYKVAFDKLCKFCHIVPEGTIITKYILTKGDENKNKIEVEYSANTRKIHLPDDITLYHISNADNIKELIPAFRGKSQKGYLYDAPRVYFSIMENMPKFLADFKPTDKTYKYICLDKSIKDVYVDPLVYTITQGAVYVVTNKPIAVEKAEIVKKAIDLSSSSETSKEKSDNKSDQEESETSATEDIKESGRFDNYPDCVDDNRVHEFMISNEEVIDSSKKIIREMTEEQINAIYDCETEIAQEVNKSCKTIFDNRAALCKRVATIDGQFDESEYNICMKRLGTHAPTFDELYDEDGKCIIDLSLSQMAYVYGIGLDFESAVARDLNKNSQKFYYYTDREDPGIYVKFKQRAVKEAGTDQDTTNSNNSANQSNTSSNSVNNTSSNSSTNNSSSTTNIASINNNQNNSTATNNSSVSSTNTNNSSTQNNNNSTSNINTTNNTNTSSSSSSNNQSSDSSNTNQNPSQNFDSSGNLKPTDDSSPASSNANNSTSTRQKSPAELAREDEETSKEQEILDKKIEAEKAEKNGNSNSTNNSSFSNNQNKDTNSVVYQKS